MTYLVQLLYPDFLTGDYGRDHFGHDVEVTPALAVMTEEERVAEVVGTARAAAVAANEGRCAPEDFAVFAVLRYTGTLDYVADVMSGL